MALDIQHGNITGTLLLEALHAAAERGVRVRLLLDDNDSEPNTGFWKRSGVFQLSLLPIEWLL